MKILFFFCCFGVMTKTLSYEWVTKFIDMPVDHFNFQNMQTFSLRYLVNDTYFKQGGPIFFYTGNEGDIDKFAKNTGFLFDIFEQFNALLVFAEHRYYGKSLPFGNLSYSAQEYLGYLSSQQALADYVYLIIHLQKIYTASGDKKLPVFAFGGSYGGMLAAWIRMKYPYAVAGALASSAPIWQFPNLNKSCSGFYDIISDVYVKHGSQRCKNTLKKYAIAIENVGKDNPGKQNLTKTFGLCKSLTSDNDVNVLQGWIGEAIVNLVEINYPYPADFLANLPGWPVKEFCKKIDAVDYSTDEGLVQALGDAMQIYSNYSQTVDCVDIFSTSTDIGDEGGWNFQGWIGEAIVNLVEINYPYPADFLANLPGWPVKEFCKKIDAVDYSTDAGLVQALGDAMQIYSNYSQTVDCVDIFSTSTDIGDEGGWNFQACTDMIQYMCSTSDDIFGESRYNFTEYQQGCLAAYTVMPQSEDVPIIEYGGLDLSGTSNIIFSNGALDPWSWAGVLTNQSDSVFAIVIPDGAHHLDLRGRNSLDTDSVKNARMFYVAQIQKWIREYYDL